MTLALGSAPARSNATTCTAFSFSFSLAEILKVVYGCVDGWLGGCAYTHARVCSRGDRVECVYGAVRLGESRRDERTQPGGERSSSSCQATATVPSSTSTSTATLHFLFAFVFLNASATVYFARRSACPCARAQVLLFWWCPFAPQSPRSTHCSSCRTKSLPCGRVGGWGGWVWY